MLNRTIWSWNLGYIIHISICIRINPWYCVSSFNAQTWTDCMFTVRGQTYDIKFCAWNKCSGWNHTSELDSWKLPVLLAWSKKLYRTKNFRKLREYLIEQRRWTAESKINRYLSDRVTRFSKYGSELGVCAQEISQSVSRLHKSISPRFQKELSAVHFQNGGSRRRWKHRLLRRFERP